MTQKINLYINGAFTASTTTAYLPVEYPIGHKRRREEGIPELIKKYKINLARVYPEKQQRVVMENSLDYATLINLNVNEFVDLLVI